MKEINVCDARIIIGGGINFTGTLLNSLKGLANTIFEIGQAVGGAIRRIGSGNLCKF